MKLSPCGIDCSACLGYEIDCEGCKGNAHFIKLEVCPIYACVIDEKGLENCGQCEALPCMLYEETRDQNVSLAAHKVGIEMRVNRLKAL